MLSYFDNLKKFLKERKSNLIANLTHSDMSFFIIFMTQNVNKFMHLCCWNINVFDCKLSNIPLAVLSDNTEYALYFVCVCVVCAYAKIAICCDLRDLCQGCKHESMLVVGSREASECVSLSLYSVIPSGSLKPSMGRVFVFVLSRVRRCDPMDHSSPGSSVHEIFQARILE